MKFIDRHAMKLREKLEAFQPANCMKSRVRKAAAMFV